MPDDILPISNPQPSVPYQCPSEPALSAVEGDQTQSRVSGNQRQSAPVLSKVEGAKKRGGPRPGAGAPRGNLNALKHGRRSRQFATIGAILSADPRVRDSLLALARRHDQKNLRAQEVAADLLVRLINHARDVAQGKASPGPFAHVARLNVVRKALSGAQSTKATKFTKRKFETALPTINHPHEQSGSRYKTTHD